jgi:hypothetical protein
LSDDEVLARALQQQFDHEAEAEAAAAAEARQAEAAQREQQRQRRRAMRAQEQQMMAEAHMSPLERLLGPRPAALAVVAAAGSDLPRPSAHQQQPPPRASAAPARQSSSSSSSRRVRLPLGASEAEIAQLPSFELLLPGSAAYLSMECQICMENFLPNEQLRQMQCMHAYHAHCLSPWLRQNRTCPICKVPLHRPEHEHE